MVERVHRIIRYGLLCYKEDLKEKYNIEYALEEVIENKNNIICRVNKKTPKELFLDDLIDNDEIKRINDLMMESQKNTNIYKNTFKLWEKILINNNIKIDNKTIKKNNKKTGLWNITGVITKIYSGGSYKVKILSDSNNYFNRNEEYYINITSIKKVDDTVWQKLNKEFQIKMDKKLEEIYGKDNKNLEDYEYFFADNSFISDSDFGLNESVDYINEEIKNKPKLYILKSKCRHNCKKK